MVHRYHGVCWYVYAAAKVLFKQCGKDFTKTYESGEKERIVSVGKIKTWLQQIRYEARSEYMSISVIILNFMSNTLILDDIFLHHSEAVLDRVSICLCSRGASHL